MSIYMKDKMEEFVIQAKMGNNSAMKTLFKMNRGNIMNLAFRYMRNREDAEEILQETFIKAFSALQRDKLKDPGSFPFWLNRIAINSSISLLRKHKSSLKLGIKEDIHTAADETAETPEDKIIENERNSEIEKAISGLSPRQRMIFTLKHYEHLKIREIAEKLDISEGSVKTQLFRAVRNLQKKLKPFVRENSHEM